MRCRSRERYPRSLGYSVDWMMDHMMGPNAVWLMEALTEVMPIEPGMRVLDLGCGKAISSIFLAKEFGAQVWATDLWISASENRSRIVDAGVEERVFPINAEAHDLPFAEGFFDAMVSVDAYHYFGTDDLFLSSYARFARPDARIGIVVPGLIEEFDEGVPEHLASVWVPEFFTFHSPAWWRRLWDRSGLVKVERAHMLASGWEDWLVWVGNEHDDGRVLEVDRGRNVGFTRVVARRTGAGQDRHGVSVVHLADDEPERWPSSGWGSPWPPVQHPLPRTTPDGHQSWSRRCMSSEVRSPTEVTPQSAIVRRTSASSMASTWSTPASPAAPSP